MQRKYVIIASIQMTKYRRNQQTEKALITYT